MSKKYKSPFDVDGIVGPSIIHTGECVLSKEDKERLAKVIVTVSVSDDGIPPEHVLRFNMSKSNPQHQISISPEVLKKHEPSMMDVIERMRQERRKTTLEQNYPVMEFLEDIIYCPSQIKFYFRADNDVMCLYIRQRHGDTTAQLVRCYDCGDFIYDELWPEIDLSREYDIEGKSYESDEAEEQEIIAIEKDCLARLRTMFPDVPFPEHPNRRRGRGHYRKEDAILE